MKKIFLALLLPLITIIPNKASQPTPTKPVVLIGVGLPGAGNFATATQGGEFDTPVEGSQYTQ